MKEAASFSETSVNFYKNAQRTNPEHSHLHTRRHENVKSHGQNYMIYTVTFKTSNNGHHIALKFYSEIETMRSFRNIKISS
jgi:hypothetical protein